jgi:carboxylate-amine ligase
MNGQASATRFAADVADVVTPPIQVEEEILLLDRRTGVNATVPVEQAPTRWLAPNRRRGGSADTVTLASPTVTDLTELRRFLLNGRRAAASVAAEHGAHLVAAGVSPVGDRAMGDFGLVRPRPAVGGLVVQFGVPDHRMAALVCRQLEAWLPVIRALTANSPYCGGADTRQASWRFTQVQRRTLGAFVAGPWFNGDPESAASKLEAAEAGLPEALRYRHISPALGNPGVRIQAGDVGLRADDTVLAVGLLRAAVSTAVAAVRAGQLDPELDPWAVRAAHWQAARDGMTARLTDPRSGRQCDAQQMLDEFVETLYPVLLAGGDSQAVWDGLARLRADGNGADRQRRIVGRTRDVRAAVPVLAELTTAE